MSNVGNGNGARRRHEPMCTCAGCANNRYMGAWGSGNHVTITLLCPSDRRHKLGTARFDTMTYQPSLTPQRATEVVGHGNDYGHDTHGREAALLTASAQRTAVRLTERYSVEVPRRVQWVCLACVRAGRIGAEKPQTVRVERLVRLAYAMAHKVDEISVPPEPQAIAAQIDKLSRMPAPRQP